MNANDANASYNAYKKSFDNVQAERDITKNGFRIIETQVFDIDHAALGLLSLIPAIHPDLNRLALFFVRKNGSVAFKTDDLMGNTWLKGQTIQTTLDVSSLAFRDLNGDGSDDIVILCVCKNESGPYTDKTYQVADVLFQSKEGFYRDPRISDKINRFDMNKTDWAVIAFVRDGISMEFLFTAKTLDELLANGFKKISFQSFPERFEKFGVVDVVSGYFTMAGQNYLMVYLIDQNGKICWNFQPMQDHVNFYAIESLSFPDIDKDGNKDFLIIAQYADYDAKGKVVIKKDYNLYVQRSGYFQEDKEWRLP